MTDARAGTLIDQLGLEAHPEGGYYRQIHRSGHVVLPADGRGARPSLTTIYFLLAEGAISRWHRVASDEVWHHYEGAPLELVELAADLETLVTHRLGPFEAAQAPVRTIPAWHWQAARSTGLYTLVGCTVGPGFEFSDFTMLSDDVGTAAEVRRRHPATTRFI